MFKRGTIILVPFPFTDLSSQKIRPAVILSREDTTHPDIVVAFISSRKPSHTRKTDIVIRDDDLHFVSTGLKITSTIRVDKLATLDKQIVLGELGSLHRSHLASVASALRYVFGL